MVCYKSHSLSNHYLLFCSLDGRKFPFFFFHCVSLCITVLCCTALYWTVLYCIVLTCTGLHCTVLYDLCVFLLQRCSGIFRCIVFYTDFCMLWQCTVLYCTVLYCTRVLYYLYNSVLYCTVLCWYLLISKFGLFFEECPYTSRKKSASPCLAATQPDMMTVIGNMVGAGLEWSLEWNGELLWL